MKTRKAMAVKSWNAWKAMFASNLIDLLGHRSFDVFVMKA
jgi:hypothetical protein